MILTKKRFPMRLLVATFIIFGFPLTVLATIQLSGGTKAILIPVSGPTLIKPAPGTYFYAGMIKNISGSSITLYNGVTCIITGSTKCMSHMSGGSMINMQTVSCSSFTKGETVHVVAVKNASGQLVATEIREAFF